MSNTVKFLLVVAAGFGGWYVWKHRSSAPVPKTGKFGTITNEQWREEGKRLGEADGTLDGVADKTKGSRNPVTKFADALSRKGTVLARNLGSEARTYLLTHASVADAFGGGYMTSYTLSYEKAYAISTGETSMSNALPPATPPVACGDIAFQLDNYGNTNTGGAHFSSAVVADFPSFLGKQIGATLKALMSLQRPTVESYDELWGALGAESAQRHASSLADDQSIAVLLDKAIDCLYAERVRKFGLPKTLGSMMGAPATSSGTRPKAAGPASGLGGFGL